MKKTGIQKEMSRLFEHLPPGATLIQRYIAAKSEGREPDQETDEAITSMLEDVLRAHETKCMTLEHALQLCERRGSEKSPEPFEATVTYLWALERLGADREAEIIHEIHTHHDWKGSTLMAYFSRNRHRAQCVVDETIKALAELKRVNDR